MINKIGTILFKAIDRISPSQYYSLKNCAYKSVLAEAFNKKPLLPISPAAYFGTVLHKMLELISKGLIKNEDDLNKFFDEQIELQERNLKQQGYAFYVPLQINVKDFGIKKILLKKHLKEGVQKKERNGQVKFYSEKWVESNDKLIAGKIDLLIQSETGIEIIDFKTGAITQDVLDLDGETYTEIKKEYTDQLKLYAYLLFENSSEFPTQLSLVDLAKQKFAIDFTKSECNIIFEDAKNLLQKTNNSIINKLFVANPSKANCNYCLFRPACSFYLKHLETDFSYHDVTGSIVKIMKFMNGNVSVILKSNDIEFNISNLSHEKFDELSLYKNRKLNFFNLRKEADYMYSATKTTMIYE